MCDADLVAPERGINAPLNIGQYLLAGRVNEGVRAGSHSLGLDQRLLDLPRALQVALEDPQGTAEKWFNGETVFESAVDSNVFPVEEDPAETAERQRLWSQLRFQKPTEA
jgi:hypothetical protein